MTPYEIADIKVCALITVMSVVSLHNYDTPLYLYTAVTLVVAIVGAKYGSRYDVYTPDASVSRVVCTITRLSLALAFNAADYALLTFLVYLWLVVDIVCHGMADIDYRAKHGLPLEIDKLKQHNVEV